MCQWIWVVTRRRLRRPEPPQPEFLTREQWADLGYDAEQFVLVSQEGDSYVIRLNGGHPVMDQQMAYYWTDEDGYFAN